MNIKSSVNSVSYTSSQPLNDKVNSAQEKTKGQSFAEFIQAESLALQHSPELSLSKSMYSTATQNQTFLEAVQEALMMQRLGINKEKVDELKEKMEELNKQFEGGEIDKETYEERLSALEEAIQREFEKGQENQKADDKSGL